jgi:hypothetical protein
MFSNASSINAKVSLDMAVGETDANPAGRPSFDQTAKTNGPPHPKKRQ